MSPASMPESVCSDFFLVSRISASSTPARTHAAARNRPFACGPDAEENRRCAGDLIVACAGDGCVAQRQPFRQAKRVGNRAPRRPSSASTPPAPCENQTYNTFARAGLRSLGRRHEIERQLKRQPLQHTRKVEILSAVL
jgi:hypothetical protein